MLFRCAAYNILRHKGSNSSGASTKKSYALPIICGDKKRKRKIKGRRMRHMKYMKYVKKIAKKSIGHEEVARSHSRRAPNDDERTVEINARM